MPQPSHFRLPLRGYSYLANSPLVGQILFKQNTTTRMTTTKAHDYLNRLTSVSSVGMASTPSQTSSAYSYNDANQRTRVNAGDGSYWSYEYDALGQVKSGKRYWNDGTPVAGQQFEYAHDDIGNRTSTKAGGNVKGSVPQKRIFSWLLSFTQALGRIARRPHRQPLGDPTQCHGRFIA